MYRLIFLPFCCTANKIAQQSQKSMILQMGREQVMVSRIAPKMHRKKNEIDLHPVTDITMHPQVPRKRMNKLVGTVFASVFHHCKRDRKRNIKRERARESERKRDRKREGEGERERESVCMCVCE